MEKERVLVVDDDEDCREMMSFFLRDCGVEVLTAKNELEALELLKNKREKVNAVLLDVLMPMVNGVEVAEQLRGLEETKDVYIGCISVLNEQFFKKEFPDGPKFCDSYIVKPGLDQIQQLAEVLKRRRKTS